MVTRRHTPSEPNRPKRLPATTPEARESRMVSLAYDLAEQRILDGTASAQEVTHFLKLGSSRERVEQEKIKGEIRVQAAKIEAMASTQRLEEMYTKAMNAFRGYQGKSPEAEESE